MEIFINGFLNALFQYTVLWKLHSEDAGDPVKYISVIIYIVGSFQF